jgi:hypothetical protein
MEATVDAQTFRDGTVSGEAQVGAGAAGATGSATVDVRMTGPSDVGTPASEVSVHSAVVGLKVRDGPNGTSTTAAFGPQIGVGAKSGTFLDAKNAPPVSFTVGSSQRVDPVGAIVNTVRASVEICASSGGGQCGM